eukprot:UN06398
MFSGMVRPGNGRDVVAYGNRPVDIIAFIANDEWTIDDTNGTIATNEQIDNVLLTVSENNKPLEKDEIELQAIEKSENEGNASDKVEEKDKNKNVRIQNKNEIDEEH